MHGVRGCRHDENDAGLLSAGALHSELRTPLAVAPLAGDGGRQVISNHQTFAHCALRTYCNTYAYE